MAKIKTIWVSIPRGCGHDVHQYSMDKGGVKQIDVTWGSDPYVTDSVTISFNDGHCECYGGNIAFWFESGPAVDHEG